MTDKNKSYLELRSIWYDDDLFELKVAASNILFSGETEVYDQYDCISGFANELTNFPDGDKTLFYEAGEKDSDAYFSMKYYPIDKAGHVGVEIILESKSANNYRKEEKNKVKLEIRVEPSAIDRFQKELFNLAKNQEGSAILFGDDNVID